MAVPEAIPAATLVLFRDGPEHLFVERAAGMAFAGGAVVFPGGKVDAGDRALAVRYPALDSDDAAARIAAIRETIEEVGIAVGVAGADTQILRQALLKGATMDVLADEHGLTFDLDALIPFARWCPNFKETRTFDTRFYLARMPAGHAAARVDATENVRLFWAHASEVLAMAAAGGVKLIFPTRRNLERLAQFGSFEAAAVHASRIPVTMITPWIEDRDGAAQLCIPDELGYPVTAEPFEQATRG